MLKIETEKYIIIITEKTNKSLQAEYNNRIDTIPQFPQAPHVTATPEQIKNAIIGAPK